MTNTSAVRVGLISDTHMPERWPSLPPAVFELFRGVDLMIRPGARIGITGRTGSGKSQTTRLVAQTLKAMGKRVAVIGAGPAGLSGAWQLARLGYPVTVFDAEAEPGGLMRTGIPSYRLPRQALDRDIDRIRALGVEFVPDSRIDHDRLDELAHEFDAVLAATGLQRLTALDLGKDMGGVTQGIEFLDQARQDAVSVRGEDVVVIGGGNTAIDAARSAWRLGAASVRILYRRTREEMPAIAEEVDEAIDEGIAIDFLCAPIRVAPDGCKRRLTCQRMELGEPDASGRRRPVPIEGSEYREDIDMAIIAIGNGSNPLIKKTSPDIEHTRWGRTIYAIGGNREAARLAGLQDWVDALGDTVDVGLLEDPSSVPGTLLVPTVDWYFHPDPDLVMPIY